MAAQITFVSIVVAAATLAGARSLAAQGDALPPPAFHHLHENGRVFLIFSPVAAPAPTRPPSAYRHQAWLTSDVRACVARARAGLVEGPGREAIELVELR